MQIRRVQSYSDSFIILGKSALDGGGLTPILVPAEEPLLEQGQQVQGQDQNQPLPLQPTHKPSRSTAVLCFLFVFKGSFHLLLISAFETLFYFLYVNRSENAGILNTINTYYQPLVNDCGTTWSNTTRWLINEIITNELNKQQIDFDGSSAAASRSKYNDSLLLWSAMYSVICAALCGGATIYVRWKGWIIPWQRMLLENFVFVLLLGLYEVFFFRTIIYNYDTLSTAELNQYIIDGLARCASADQIDGGPRFARVSEW